MQVFYPCIPRRNTGVSAYVRDAAVAMRFWSRGRASEADRGVQQWLCSRQRRLSSRSTGCGKTRFSALQLIDWRQRRVRLCRASGQHWQAHCLDREGKVLAPGSLKYRQNHFIFRWLGDRKMRHVLITLTSFALLGGASAAQARELAANDRYVCSWGAGTAARAQELKLSGVSLYAARQKIQTYKFSKGWMRMMALGITEQTYDSPSRIKPEALRKSFNEDCLRYKLARR